MYVYFTTHSTSNLHQHQQNRHCRHRLSFSLSLYPYHHQIFNGKFSCCPPPCLVILIPIFMCLLLHVIVHSVLRFTSGKFPFRKTHHANKILFMWISELCALRAHIKFTVVHFFSPLRKLQKGKTWTSFYFMKLNDKFLLIDLRCAFECAPYFSVCKMAWWKEQKQTLA